MDGGSTCREMESGNRGGNPCQDPKSIFSRFDGTRKDAPKTFASEHGEGLGACAMLEGGGSIRRTSFSKTADDVARSGCHM